MLRVPFLFSLVLGCGGIYVVDTSGDSGPSGGSGVDAGGLDAWGGSDARGEDSGALRDRQGPGRDAPPVDRCENAMRELERVTLEAQRCCPMCDIEQCVTVAPGLCCDVTVAQGARVAEITALLGEVRRVCGEFPCPAVVCPVVPSGECNEATSRCQ